VSWSKQVQRSQCEDEQNQPSDHETVSPLCRFDLCLGLCFCLIEHFLNSLFELFFVFYLLLECLIRGF